MFRRIIGGGSASPHSHTNPAYSGGLTLVSDRFRQVSLNLGDARLQPNLVAAHQLLNAIVGEKSFSCGCQGSRQRKRATPIDEKPLG